ncbi:MAG: sugar ABC transporter permease [Clostridiales bacterium]|nr:sugar ABC transporter permease [Clostridiales bacterium]
MVRTACKNKKMGKVNKRQRLFKFLFVKYQIHGLLWVLPAVLMLAFFCYIPQVWAFVYSFSDWGIYLNISFTGFENYLRAFQDTVYWSSYGNVLLFTFFGVLFSNIGCILLTELMFALKMEKLSAFYRFMFLLPSIVPGVVGTLVWSKVIFLPASGVRTGVANAILGLFGIEGLDWYYSAETVKLTYILTGFPWMGGTGFLICLAALQGINSEVIDASKIDGFGIMQRVFHIDIPLIKPQLKYFVVTGIIAGIQNYGMQVILATDNAMVPGYYIYLTGVSYSEYGYACALGVIIFIIILTLTLTTNKLIKTEEL